MRMAASRLNESLVSEIQKRGVAIPPLDGDRTGRCVNPDTSQQVNRK
jgi:hypothetical protein